MNAVRNEMIINMPAEGFWNWDLKADSAFPGPRCCEPAGHSPEDTNFDSNSIRTIDHPDDRGTIIEITECRKTEERLKESEERFRTTVENSPNMVMIHVDGKLVYLNPACVSMFGIENQQEYIGKPIIEVVHPDFRNLDPASVGNRPDDTRRNFKSEKQLLRKDGSSYWVEMTDIPSSYEGNTAVHVIAVDISERKRAEKALLESETQLWTMLQSTADGILAVDCNGRLLHANQRFRELWRIPRNLMACGNDQTLLDFVLDQLLDPDAFIGKVQLLYGSKEVDFDTLTFKDGRVFERYSSPMITDGAVIGRVWSFRDITERVRVELENRRLLLRQRAILDSLPMMAWLKDTESRLEMVNEPYAKACGHTVEECIGKTDLDLFPPDLAGRYLDDDRDVCTTGRKKQVDESITSPDGTKWHLTYKTPLFDEQGQVVGTAGISQDITERKRAEEKLQRKNDEIEQIIYSVSHDLRSPLVTVKTFMGFLEKDMAEGNQEQLDQDIRFIHGAADKMKLMLDELLEMTRIDRVDTSPVRVSLMDVLDEVLNTLAGIISEKKVEILPPDTDLMLFGDRPRLCQIWQNLIENAIKYSRDNSIPRIELGIRQHNGDMLFFVKDNGIGIAPQYHGKIFGIFEKLNSKSPGAGLGLSMIQRIVDKCGGRIWVESEGIGKGSCFIFTLPHVVVQN